MHSRGVTLDRAVRSGVYLKTNSFPQVHRRPHDRRWSNGDEYCQLGIWHYPRGGSLIFIEAHGSVRGILPCKPLTFFSVEIVYSTECGNNGLKVTYYRVNDTEG